MQLDGKFYANGRKAETEELKKGKNRLNSRVRSTSPYFKPEIRWFESFEAVCEARKSRTLWQFA